MHCLLHQVTAPLATAHAGRKLCYRGMPPRQLLRRDNTKVKATLRPPSWLCRKRRLCLLVSLPRRATDRPRLAGRARCMRPPATWWDVSCAALAALSCGDRVLRAAAEPGAFLLAALTLLEGPEPLATEAGGASLGFWPFTCCRAALPQASQRQLPWNRQPPGQLGFHLSQDRAMQGCRWNSMRSLPMPPPLDLHAERSWLATRHDCCSCTSASRALNNSCCTSSAVAITAGPSHARFCETSGQRRHLGQFSQSDTGRVCAAAAICACDQRARVPAHCTCGRRMGQRTLVSAEKLHQLLQGDPCFRQEDALPWATLLAASMLLKCRARHSLATAH